MNRSKNNIKNMLTGYDPSYYGIRYVPTGFVDWWRLHAEDSRYTVEGYSPSWDLSHAAAGGMA